MPLPRFHRLDPDRQAQILDAAAEEFGAHGYASASMNRIIEAADLSKGAMYYYFDGKADLWGALLEAAFEELGPFDAAFEAVTDAASFWTTFEALFAGAQDLYKSSPRMAAMVRAMIKSPADETMLAATTHGMQGMRGAFDTIVRLGQRLGAVRTDLPPARLVDLLFAINNCTDLWLAEATLDGDEEAAQALLATVIDLNHRLLRK